MARVTGDPSVLIWMVRRPSAHFDLHCIFSSECPVSLDSGELGSAQLGSSEWGILWWIIRYVIPDLVLAVSWRFHARPTASREIG